MPKNEVSIEFLGRGYPLTLQYERIFTNKKGGPFSCGTGFFMFPIFDEIVYEIPIFARVYFPFYLKSKAIKPYNWHNSLYGDIGTTLIFEDKYKDHYPSIGFGFSSYAGNGNVYFHYKIGIIFYHNKLTNPGLLSLSLGLLF